MRNPEVDSATLGAEALPGGLVEFNNAMGFETRTANQSGPHRAKAPLLGLVVLALHWMRQRGNRD